MISMSQQITVDNMTISRVEFIPAADDHSRDVCLISVAAKNGDEVHQEFQLVLCDQSPEEMADDVRVGYSRGLAFDGGTASRVVCKLATGYTDALAAFLKSGFQGLADHLVASKRITW